jgi:hypothetical protein
LVPWYTNTIGSIVGKDEYCEDDKLRNSVSCGSDTGTSTEMSTSTGNGTTTTEKEEENDKKHPAQKDKVTGTSTGEGTWSLVVSRKDRKEIRTANRNTNHRNKFAKLTTLQTIRSR